MRRACCSGSAGAVKYWAAIPALGLLVVVPPAAAGPAATGRRAGDAGRADQPARPGSAAGTVAAFTVAVAPFAAPWPGLFVRSTLLDQAARAGSAVPEPLRLANLTGLGLLLDDAGRFTGSTGVLAVRPGRRDRRGDLGHRRAAGAARLSRASPWPASATAPGGPARWAGTRLGALAGTAAAVLGYSAFFYHYGDFAAPWLALSAGFAVAGLRERAARLRLRRGRRAGRRRGRRRRAGRAAAAG